MWSMMVRVKVESVSPPIGRRTAHQPSLPSENDVNQIFYFLDNIQLRCKNGSFEHVGISRRTGFGVRIRCSQRTAQGVWEDTVARERSLPAWVKDKL